MRHAKVLTSLACWPELLHHVYNCESIADHINNSRLALLLLSHLSTLMILFRLIRIGLESRRLDLTLSIWNASISQTELIWFFQHLLGRPSVGDSERCWSLALKNWFILKNCKWKSHIYYCHYVLPFFCCDYIIFCRLGSHICTYMKLLRSKYIRKASLVLGVWPLNARVHSKCIERANHRVFHVTPTTMIDEFI